MSDNEKLREECGVFGIYDKSRTVDCSRTAYDALCALQHRGREGAGIASFDGSELLCHKGKGLVGEVFGNFDLASLGGNSAIGHVSFVTDELGEALSPQPIVSKYINGSIAVANNGGLENRKKLIDELTQNGEVLKHDTDAEVITRLLVLERTNAISTEEALASVMQKLSGAYSLVVLTPDKLIAARDSHGIRPLCIGRKGEAYVVASEDSALNAVGAEFVRDVEPGEIITVTDKGLSSDKPFAGQCRPSTCIFEYIYFAGADSTIGGQRVDEARIKAGEILGSETGVGADVVMGVPDSGLLAAKGYAKSSGLPYIEGIEKVKSDSPENCLDDRRRNAELRVTAPEEAIKGKRVVLVDDSIIRGTTGARLVKQLREAGASEVHMRVSSPPFMWRCFYGADIPNKHELAANNLSCEGLRQKIGANSLGYLDVEDLPRIVPKLEGFCDACFSGKYPTEY